MVGAVAVVVAWREGAKERTKGLVVRTVLWTRMVQAQTQTQAQARAQAQAVWQVLPHKQ